jgi:dTDP-4-amino-4,6-dideoxygalactose transaminase
MEKIPFVDLGAQYKSIKSDIDSAIAAVIEQTAFIGGKYVKQFEADFAKEFGVNHVVACANGTDSLYIIMKSLGIGPGDEVMTVANSWISSSETIGQTGAKPVFIDIEEQFMSMDASQLEKYLTPQTKAIIAVHLQGQYIDLDAIQAFCEQHNIYLIEDCAQAHLSSSNGKIAGTNGIAGSFSFYPGKNLGAYGDAGCIITNDAELAEKCRMYANHGALVKHQHQIEGINSRMDGLQAAILGVKLPHLKSWTAKRRENARIYSNLLAKISQIKTPAERPNTEHSYHLYVIRCQQRDELKVYLQENGVETAIHYPTPLPLLPAYQKQGYSASAYPVAEKVSKEILSLPMYPELSEAQIAHIANTIQAFYAKH